MQSEHQMEAERSKEVYSPPKLTVHGTVAEITAALENGPTDGIVGGTIAGSPVP